MRSLFRSTFAQLLMVAVVIGALFAAPFAEAGTLAVNQAYYASTPQHDLTATVACHDTTMVLTGQRSSDDQTATLLMKAKNHLIGGIAMATFASASIQPGVALLEKRSPVSTTSLDT